jgi:hypothetical protein
VIQLASYFHTSVIFKVFGLPFIHHSSQGFSMKRGQIVTAKIMPFHILLCLRAIFAKENGGIIYNETISCWVFLLFFFSSESKILL